MLPLGANRRRELERHNADQLAYFGMDCVLSPIGSGASPFRAVRRRGNALENETTGAYERVWTTATELPTWPQTGGTVLLGTVEYLVHDVKPDEDPNSNGFTVYLNRKKPLNA